MPKTLSGLGLEDGDLRVLVVDDEAPIRKLLHSYLEKLGAQVDSAADGMRAMEYVHRGSHDLVLLDLMMPVRDGLQTLRVLRKVDSEVPVLVMTGFGTIERAVAAMKAGATEFLLKPLSFKELGEMVARIRERQRIVRGVQDPSSAAETGQDELRILTCDMAMLRLLKLVRKIAPLPSTVLIQGESGTGKELVARAIHRESGKAENRFVAINCGAIPDQLLESELFGYERGAFTGAGSRKIGFFEAAEDGTMFLDEISEMSMDLQVKLLRVIQERSFHRLGSTKEIPTSARIIASTNRDLEQEVARGRFRQDLYYRINVVRIEVPPLRERPDDIALLSGHFLARYAREFQKELSGIDHDAMELLRSHAWSGNIRELENVIERAVAVAEGGRITEADLPDDVKRPGRARRQRADLEPFGSAKRRFEKEYLSRVLERVQGNVSLASRLTAIPRQNLYSKLEKYGINIDDFRQAPQPDLDDTE